MGIENSIAGPRQLFAPLRHRPMQKTILLIAAALGWATFFGDTQAVTAWADSAGRPDWIWATADQSDHRPARLSRSLSVAEGVVSATLRCVGQSAGMSVSIDHQPLAELEPYDPLWIRDITDMLARGKHQLTIQTSGVEGPSAVFLQLEVEYSDGRVERVVTNSDWRSQRSGVSRPAVSFGEVDPRLVIPKSRLVGIKAIDNYEQWKQALGASAGSNPASFEITPGFEIQLIKSASPDEGSWVSMAVDPQGRLVIGKEERGLLRMTLSARQDKVVRTELIEDSLEECRGLLFVGDDLYANANNSKGLYRLSGLGQDRFAAPELVFASSGGVGHGRNDLALGPDGMIYSIHGDAVDLPTGVTDHTSPLREARGGRKTSEGHLVRIDPKQGTVEVLAGGLRNPFGIDFNPAGDLFTYDADAEYDMGAPWYRPTRVSQLVVGGDYGWRGVTRSWPSYYPDHADNARPNLDIGKGSPTAVKFGSRSHFPATYREALFILDWAYGRVLAVHCLPRGSSYLMSSETFLQGRPLNVTDLDFGPDGAMYLITGGRKTQSALYRVRYVGDHAESAHTESSQNQAQRRYAKQARRKRLKLELELQQGSAQAKEAWEYLDHSDPWIAQAASHLLEQAPVETWQDLALTETRLNRAVRALLSLARTRQAKRMPPVVQRLNQLPIQWASTSIKLAALQAYSLCLDDELIQRESETISLTRDKLNAMYPDKTYPVNRLLSELLVRVGAPDVVNKTIGRLKATSDQAQQMHYLYVLRGVSSGWTLADRRAYFEALAQSQYYLAGAGMPDFVKRIRQESISTLTEPERQQLGAIVDPPTDVVIVRRSAEPRKLVQQWKVEDFDSLDNQTGARDIQRGKAVFETAACIQCHRIAGRGRPVGPDLTAASRRFSRRDLLVAMLAPSQVIAENYQSLQILTQDGQIHVGQPVLGGDYRSPKLRLATDPANPTKVIEIPKSSIQLQKTSPQSWMPDGLLDTFSREEILDLIAYIESAASMAR
ncbi:MAG: c-type cytochrome [Pirellulales bacterium]|nr:c-type cytochrome [Pirellulales bacterium]